MNFKGLVLTIAAGLLIHTGKAETVKETSEALIKRIIPTHAHFFSVESINSPDSIDRFELESRKQNIILRGNNGTG